MNLPGRVKPFLLVLALCTVCTAQSKRSASPARETQLRDHQLAVRIDRYVQSEMRKYKIPGVSLAVLRNGRVSLLKSYGMANVELAVPVRPETIFQTGSIGKQFTAAAVLVLVQEGKLALNDKIVVPARHPDAWKDSPSESADAYFRDG